MSNYISIFGFVFGFLVGGVISAVAGEQRFTATWEPPQMDVSGNPLPLNEITGYRVYYSFDGPADKQDNFVAVTEGGESILSLTLAPGDYQVYFGVSALRRLGEEYYESDLQNAPGQGLPEQAVLNFTVKMDDPTPAIIPAVTVIIQCTGGGCVVE